ncbi:hypothetical protein NDU88_011032 [Pleurodeles waltl]|uniref:Uncharacterized protein n=1 Tax=Pleurodeles waltl TaxID=8319 RepID=A0AAV7QXM7_PLEWA|nr:hypothetical protein NDU88_011032 [Pleurodeles waltl]
MHHVATIRAWCPAPSKVWRRGHPTIRAALCREHLSSSSPRFTHTPPAATKGSAGSCGGCSAGAPGRWDPMSTQAWGSSLTAGRVKRLLSAHKLERPEQLSRFPGLFRTLYRVLTPTGQME